MFLFGSTSLYSSPPPSFTPPPLNAAKPPEGGFDKHDRDLCLAFGVETLILAFQLKRIPRDALLVASLDLVENPFAFRLR